MAMQRQAGKGATVFEWLNCPIYQREQPVMILSNDFPQGKILSILQPPWSIVTTICTAADFDSLAWCDFETFAEDPSSDDVVTVRPTHVHGCHHPPLQCHTMPWERLINICITVILIPLLPTPPPYNMPCHLPCLGIARSGWRR